MLKRAESYVTE
jgi:large subunit ribosomal protein L7e